MRNRRPGLVFAALLLAAAAINAQQAPPAQPAPPGTGLIVGQVIDADTNRPVGETIVTLMPSDGAVNPTTAIATAQKLITDAEGRFVYRNLAKGRYSIDATKPGYVRGAYGRNVPRGPTTLLDLADGERVTDVRILVWKHAAITGRVVDEAGEPVVLAEIRVRRVATVGGRPGYQSAAPGTILTDDRGVYRAGGLEPGSYVIGIAAQSTTVPAPIIAAVTSGAAGVVRTEMQQALGGSARFFPLPGSSGYQVIGDHIIQLDGRMPIPPASTSGESLAVYAATYYPQTTRIDDSTVITVKGGETQAGIDLSIRAVPGRRVSGRLAGPDAGVGIASLFLVQTIAGEPIATTTEAAATAVSDANGAFTFLGVPPGQYALFVMKWPLMGTPAASQMTVIQGPGGTTARGVVSAGGNEIKAAYWAQQSLTVADWDLPDVSVPMQLGLRVAGKVQFEGPGQPPPVARIIPFLESTAMWLRPMSFGEGNVGSDGAFALSGAPAGRYFLTVPAPDGWYTKSAISNGRDFSDLPFDLTADVGDVVVTLSSRGAGVTGTVRDRSSKPESGPGVIVFPVDSRYWVDISAYARRIRQALAGRDGTFSLGDLPAGDYFIVAAPQRSIDWSMPRLFERLSQVATRITLAEGERKTVDLQTAQVR